MPSSEKYFETKIFVSRLFRKQKFGKFNITKEHNQKNKNLLQETKLLF